MDLPRAAVVPRSGCSSFQTQLSLLRLSDAVGYLSSVRIRVGNGAGSVSSEVSAEQQAAP